MGILNVPVGRCKMVLTDDLVGIQYEVERLEPKRGEFTKGFRLTCLEQGLDGHVAFVHQLPVGLHECSCGCWLENRECYHTVLLTAAGLLDQPVRLEDLYPADALEAVAGEVF